MGYDIFHNYFNESMNSPWKLQAVKNVTDSDGFATEYAWYSDGERHIFMFGDTDTVAPDPDYADWETDDEETAQEWFEDYTGFDNWEEDVSPVEAFECWNKDFINDGFARIYGLAELENKDTIDLMNESNSSTKFNPVDSDNISIKSVRK